MCLNSKVCTPPLPRLGLCLTYGLSQIPAFLVGDGYLLLGSFLTCNLHTRKPPASTLPEYCPPRAPACSGGCHCDDRFAHEVSVAERVTIQPPTPNSKKPRESLPSPVSSPSPYSTQMITEDSVVYYNYSITGTVTVKLRVVAEWERATPDAGKGVAQRTGDFSTSLKLQGGSLGGWRRWSDFHLPVTLASGRGHKAQWAVPQGTAQGGDAEIRLSLALAKGASGALQQSSRLCCGDTMGWPFAHAVQMVGDRGTPSHLGSGAC